MKAMIDFFATVLSYFFDLIPRKSPLPVSHDPARAREPVSFPLQDSEMHVGFVNSMQNQYGMQARFYVDSPTAVSAEWSNTDGRFSGFPGIIHGGILAALADELMANGVLALQKKLSVSLRMNIKWMRPARVGETVYGRASLSFKIGPMSWVRGSLFDEKGRELVRSTGVFFQPKASQLERMTRVSVPPELRTLLR